MTVEVNWNNEQPTIDFKDRVLLLTRANLTQLLCDSATTAAVLKVPGYRMPKDSPVGDNFRIFSAPHFPTDYQLTLTGFAVRDYEETVDLVFGDLVRNPIEAQQEPEPTAAAEEDSGGDITETIGRVAQILIVGERDGFVTLTSIESVPGEGEPKQPLSFSVEEPVLNSMKSHTENFPNVKALYHHLSSRLHQAAMQV